MKKILFAFTVLAVAALSGCTKSYLDINQNPNQPLSVTPDVVLASALSTSASNVGRDYPGLARWMGYWSRSGNYVPDVQTETYNVFNDYTDGEWNALYTTINNYDYIEKTAQGLNLPFYIGAAKVMKAFHFSTLVDVYNNVPYSEAFKVVTNIQPKYDDAQTIYNDIVAQLDSSIDYFEQAKTYYNDAATANTITSDDQHDILFGSARTGSSSTDDRMVMWEKFANTVKLKLLIHQSEVSAQQSFIQQEIGKINANGFGYLGANESAAVNPAYQAATGKINPFYSIFYTVSGTTTANFNYYRANTYGVNFYVNTSDIRQAYVYTGNTLGPGSNYDGDINLLSNSGTAAVGPALLKDFSQDQLILSDFESLFLQAEAAQRGWIDGDAQALYQSAVEQNFVYLYKDYDDVDDPIADADAYLSGDLLGSGPLNDVNWDVSDNKLELILTQKWGAFNGINWMEAWTDYRRTGYPTSEFLGLTKALNPLKPQIPIRYLYPQVELNTNGANVPSEGSHAGDQFTAKVFWDK